MLPVPLPPIQLQQRFGAFAKYSYELTTLLRRENINLRAARDLLLSKLISGEIDLSGAMDEVERTQARVAAE
jgi:type I restriction enzyme S subunit